MVHAREKGGEIDLAHVQQGVPAENRLLGQFDEP